MLIYFKNTQCFQFTTYCRIFSCMLMQPSALLRLAYNILAHPSFNSFFIALLFVVLFLFPFSLLLFFVCFILLSLYLYFLCFFFSFLHSVFILYPFSSVLFAKTSCFLLRFASSLSYTTILIIKCFSLLLVK